MVPGPFWHPQGNIVRLKRNNFHLGWEVGVRERQRDPKSCLDQVLTVC
jgi:hypothetical protein